MNADGRCSLQPARGYDDHVGQFTSSTVTARYGSVIHTYDEHGMTIYSKAA